MHDDVGEFEDTTKIKRELRLIDLAQEEKKISEASQKIEMLSEIEQNAMIDNQEMRLKLMWQDEQIHREKEEEILHQKVEQRRQGKKEKLLEKLKTVFPDIKGGKNRAGGERAHEKSSLSRLLALPPLQMNNNPVKPSYSNIRATKRVTDKGSI